jgi:hypothetical protein
VSERDGQVFNLNQVVSERDGEIDDLHGQALELHREIEANIYERTKIIDTICSVI